MFIREAKAIADGLIAQMAPYCERIEIAGSIRRGRQEVKDIELVAVPNWEDAQTGLFADTHSAVNKLHHWATAAAAGGIVRWLKPGTHEIIDWPLKPGGRYWRGLIHERIKLDLFLTTGQNFGLIYLIRTGCAEFSQGVMTHALRATNFRVQAGALLEKASGRVQQTPDERAVFGLLGLAYVEPAARTGFAAVTRAGGGSVFPADYKIAQMAAQR